MRAVRASRQEELLHDCVVPPQVFGHLVDRLCHFVVPYQHCLETEAGQRSVHLYLEGLLSHLGRKTPRRLRPWSMSSAWSCKSLSVRTHGTIARWSRCWSVKWCSGWGNPMG
jgi:hypothetical protein